MRNTLLIVQMGHPPEDIRHDFGEQPDWFRRALGELGVHTQVVSPFLGHALPDVDAHAGAVITGAWEMVTDRADWSERTGDWARAMVAAERPLLGVCYGHQLMAHALGGVVDYHPQGSEVGRLPVTLHAAAKGDAFLGHLPESFEAFLTHEQSVLVPPAGATVLGRSDHDPHQILRYGPKALSVQFHPEFTAPLLEACLQRGAERHAAAGRDVAAMRARLGPTPESTDLLRRFAALAGL